jgi:hypothetical protein
MSYLLLGLVGYEKLRRAHWAEGWECEFYG